MKARDGTTDICGTFYVQSNLDLKGKYSVLDSAYPGPQNIGPARRYQTGSPEPAVSELGFVVVQIDGLGTPFRSKAFHDFSCGNLGDAGLEHQITALRQLARQLPYLDLADGCAMNKVEAQTLLDEQLAAYRSQGYEELVEKVGSTIAFATVGPSGAEYNVEVIVLWDSPARRSMCE